MSDAETPSTPAPASVGPSGVASGRQLLRSSLFVSMGTGLSRLTGFLRVAVMAWALGTSALAEAYNLANNTPNLIYDLVLGGILSATLVPVIVEWSNREDRSGIDAVATVITLTLGATTVAAMAAAPLVIWLFNIGAPAGQFADQSRVAIPLLILFAPQILFYGLTALGSAILNVRGSFAVPAFAPVLNNVVVICLFLALPRIAGGEAPDLDQVASDRGLLALLGLGTTAGIMAMTLVLWPELRRRNVTLRWNPDPRHPAVREIGRLSAWTLGYVITNLVAYFIVQTMANGIDGVTVYAYAWLFFQLPYGLWTVSVMTAYTPELAQLSSRGELVQLRSRFTDGLRLVLVLALPAAIGMAALSGPLVRLILERGAFDGASAEITADMLAAFSLGLPGFSAFLFTMRGFYAGRDTRTPFLLNLGESVFMLSLAVILLGPYGVVGLGAAGSIAYSAFAAVAIAVLWRRIGPLFDRRASLALLKLLVAAVVMGAAVIGLLGFTELNDLVSSVLAIAVGVIIYVAMLVALRSDETRLVLARLRRR